MMKRLLASGLLSLSLVTVTGILWAQDETTYTVKERINRIRALGKSDSEAIPGLQGYLNDPNRDIRVEAVKAIVRIGGERSLTPLLKATEDNDSEVQIRATDGLVNFYLPGYVAKGGLTGPLMRGVRQVKGFFSSRDDQTIDPSIIVRTDVGDALGRLAATGSNFDARADAALGAGILRAHPALPSLIEALKSKDSSLIFECLVALQKIGDPFAGPRVIFLANDFDERVQTTALETLGVLHTTEGSPEVRRALANGKNAKIRRTALESLAMLAQPEDRSLFKQYARDDDGDLRASALEGLGRLREPDDFPLIEQAYNEKGADQKVHLSAAFALVRQGKTEISEFSPLRYVVDELDSKPYGADATAYLVELCADHQVRQALFPLVPEATKSQKIAFCTAFASSHDPDVLPSLQLMTKDIDPSVALAAARSIQIAKARRSP